MEIPVTIRQNYFYRLAKNELEQRMKDLCVYFYFDNKKLTYEQNVETIKNTIINIVTEGRFLDCYPHCFADKEKEYEIDSIIETAAEDFIDSIETGEWDEWFKRSLNQKQPLG